MSSAVGGRSTGQIPMPIQSTGQLAIGKCAWTCTPSPAHGTPPPTALHRRCSAAPVQLRRRGAQPGAPEPCAHAPAPRASATAPRLHTLTVATACRRVLQLCAATSPSGVRFPVPQGCQRENGCRKSRDVHARDPALGTNQARRCHKPVLAVRPLCGAHSTAPSAPTCGRVRSGLPGCTCLLPGVLWPFDFPTHVGVCASSMRRVQCALSASLHVHVHCIAWKSADTVLQFLQHPNPKIRLAGPGLLQR